MKLTALLIASAAAQNSLVDVFTNDRKFSDNPENEETGIGFLDQAVWDNYHDQRPAYRVEQLRCRIPQYFEKFFAGNGKVHDKLKRLWEGVVYSIEESFQKCHGPLYDKEVTCSWTEWLNKDDDQAANTRKATNHFVTGFGVAVREFIYRSDQRSGCEAKGMRLVSFIFKILVFTAFL